MAIRGSYLSLTRRFFMCNRPILNEQSRSASTSLTESKSDEPVYALEEYDDSDNTDVQVEIESKRNKSRLSEKHLNILKGLPPTPGSDDFHKSIKYKRKIYGLYGKASSIDPGTLWPNQSDLDNIREYESVAVPFAYHEMLSHVKDKRLEEQRIIQARQKKLADNLKKVAQWAKEVEIRKEKKLKELSAAKEKKDKLLEEVRKQLGHKIDVKDERFKQALVQKEKDMKKKVKEEKTKAKQERLLKAMHEEASTS